LRNLRGASHYGHWVERTLDELPLRGQGRSPLIYTNCGVCLCLEKKFVLLRRVWVSINIEDKLLPNSWRQNSQKVLSIGILEYKLLILAFVLLTQGHNLKRPLESVTFCLNPYLLVGTTGIIWWYRTITLRLSKIFDLVKQTMPWVRTSTCIKRKGFLSCACPGTH
jgi:hypothetical protein